MKCTAFVTMTALAASLASAAEAPTGSVCNPMMEVRNALASRYSDTSEPRPTVFLGLDHRTKRWSAARITWSDDGPKLTPEPFKLQLNNVPQLKVTSRDLPAVALFDTNVMLYEVTALEAKERDVEDLADLQQFTGLLGGALTALTRAIGAKDAQTKLSDEAGPDRSGPRRLVVTELDRLTVTQIENAAKRIRARDAQRWAGAKSALDMLKEKMTALSRRTTDAQKRTASVRPYLQDLEFVVPATERLNRDGLLTGLRTNTEPLIEAVKKAADEESLNLPCVMTHKRLRETVELTAAPTPPSDISDARRDFFLAVANLRDASVMEGDGCEAMEIKDFGEIVTALSRLPPTEAGFNEGLWTVWEPLRALALAYESQGTLVQAAGAKVAAVLAKGNELLSQADYLEALGRREALHPGRDACALATGTLFVDESYASLEWSKVREAGFKVEAQPPYSSQVQRADTGDLTGKYELARKRPFTFQLGFGLVYTGLSEPVWSAVADPLAGESKVIVRTDEKTRAGQPTMFMTLAPTSLADKPGAFGLDLGVGVADDQPSLYLGGSVALGTFARFGGGVTVQRVKELRPEQIERTLRADGTLDPRSVVASADAIRTRDGLDHAFYLSLTVTLNGLPFFKPLD